MGRTIRPVDRLAAASDFESITGDDGARLDERTLGGSFHTQRKRSQELKTEETGRRRLLPIQSRDNNGGNLTGVGGDYREGAVWGQNMFFIS